MAVETSNVQTGRNSQVFTFICGSIPGSETFALDGLTSFRNASEGEIVLADVKEWVSEKDGDPLWFNVSEHKYDHLLHKPMNASSMTD
jgi:hypothetical protein